MNRICVCGWVVLGGKGQVLRRKSVGTVFARQNGRVGAQYPKAQEFEAANATLG